MNNFTRHFLIYGTALIIIFCLFPTHLLAQSLFPGVVPPGSSKIVTAQGGAQQPSSGNATAESANALNDFLARYDTCSWYAPSDPYQDRYLELHNGHLTFYEYNKDDVFCQLLNKTCFSQDELWRIKVTGFNIISRDLKENAFRVNINRNGDKIEIQGIGKSGGDEYSGTYIRTHCSVQENNPGNP